MVETLDCIAFILGKWHFLFFVLIIPVANHSYHTCCLLVSDVCVFQSIKEHLDSISVGNVPYVISAWKHLIKALH